MGDAQRKVSMTQFNDESSRSHTLCRVSIESCNAEARSERMISTLNLIDLAGSESARAAMSQNHRMEGSFINKSLLTLGAVISKLSEGSAKHIPFRDSKLTRLLQPSLSGSGAKVAVVCCITPAAAQVRNRCCLVGVNDDICKGLR
jgi:centromeric protein E